VDQLILARHAHARSNAGGVVSCLPPGEGLSERGREEALALREALAGEPVDLGVASELERTQETLDLALGDRSVPRLVLPAWNEIHFGSFEGGPLAAYREWAWSNEAGAACPGGGESRAEAARRIAAALQALLERPERTVLAVGHALPIRYVLDASDGRFPEARIEPVGHATAHRLGAGQVAAAARSLRRWSDAPSFRPGKAQP
jgi:probable phosphoglycerate mutase